MIECSVIIINTLPKNLLQPASFSQSSARRKICFEMVEEKDACERYHELGRKIINLPVGYKLLNSTFFKYIFNCFFSLSRYLWATEGSQNFNVYKLCRLQRATSERKEGKFNSHSSNISVWKCSKCVHCHWS